MGVVNLAIPAPVRAAGGPRPKIGAARPSLVFDAAGQYQTYAIALPATYVEATEVRLWFATPSLLSGTITFSVRLRSGSPGAQVSLFDVSFGPGNSVQVPVPNAAGIIQEVVIPIIYPGAATGGDLLEMRIATDALPGAIDVYDIALGYAEAAPAVAEAHTAPDQLWSFTNAMPSGWEVVQSTQAMGRNLTTGRWETVPANSYRPWINPSTLTNPGQLSEPSSSQYVLGDEPWTHGNLYPPTYVTGQTTPMPSTRKVAQVRAEAITQSHAISIDATGFAAVPSSGNMTFWLTAKPAGSQRYVRVDLRDKAGVEHTAVLDLTGLTTVSADAGVTGRIAANTDGFVDFGLSVAVDNVGSSGFYCTLSLLDAAQAVNYLGSTADGLDIAHVQLEDTGIWTSPILPVGALSQRPADHVRPTTTGWVQPNGGTWGVNFAPVGAVRATHTNTILDAWKDASNRWRLRGVNGTATAIATTAGTDEATLTGDALALNTPTTAVYAMADNFFRLAQDGTVKATDTLGLIPTDLTGVRFGTDVDATSATPMGAFVVRHVAYWNAALTSSDALVYWSTDLTQPGDNNPPVVSIPQTASVTEGGTLALTVTKSGRGECRVSVQTRDGTALAGTHYDATTQELVFPYASGDLTFSVITMQDAVTNGDLTFYVDLVSGVGCAFGNAITTVTRVDDEVA